MALRLATDEHWDLLVTDLDMPGMTGLELLGALRQVAPGLPVAVVSAHALDGAPAGLPGDADRYLEKPLRVDQLIATATALIGRGTPALGRGLSGHSRARYPADVTVEIAGAGVVVTGAGSGIGRALARGLAAAGARVVVNDLNVEAATAVAEEIGGYPAPGDVSTEPGVHDLIDAAREYLNEIDIYCSNAGIAIGAGPDAPEEAWQQSWEVNADGPRAGVA